MAKMPGTSTTAEHFVRSPTTPTSAHIIPGNSFEGVVYLVFPGDFYGVPAIPRLQGLGHASQLGGGGLGLSGGVGLGIGGLGGGLGLGWRRGGLTAPGPRLGLGGTQLGTDAVEGMPVPKIPKIMGASHLSNNDIQPTEQLVPPNQIAPNSPQSAGITQQLTPLLNSPTPYRLPSPSISSGMPFPGLTPLSPSTQPFFFMLTTPVMSANPATFFPPTMSQDTRPPTFPFSQAIISSQSNSSYINQPGTVNYPPQQMQGGTNSMLPSRGVTQNSIPRPPQGYRNQNLEAAAAATAAVVAAATAATARTQQLLKTNENVPFNHPSQLSQAQAQPEAISLSSTQHQFSGIQQQAKIMTESIERDLQTTSKEGNLPIICTGCETPILDRFILKVLDKPWHAKCMRCSDCQIHLTDECYSRGGHIFCEEDFARRFGPKCAGCNQPFTTQMIRRAQDNIYHLECFACFICSRQLSPSDEFYHMDDKKLVCKADYEAARAREKIRLLLKKKKLIRTKGACIIYSGPPRVGKSTVLHRTVKDYYAVIPTLPSTPVAEKPLRIHIKKLSATRAAKKGSRWVEQTLEQEKQQLVGYSLSTDETQPEVMTEDDSSETESSASGSTTDDGESLELDGSSAEATAAVENKAGVHTVPSPTTDTKVGEKHFPSPVNTPTFETPDDIVREALRSAAALHEDLDLLEGSIMLHILDTGGQPQFMQVLPMLYTGPSINLLVFKLNEGLEERYVIEYLSPDGETTEPCVSSFTVEQVLFQALSSASFRVAPSVTPVSAGPTSSQSATIFVGTHKDKVSQQEIDSIDDALQRKLRNSTILNSKVIKYHNPTKQPPSFSVVVPIDNTSIEDPGILLLQDLVNDVLQKQFDDYDTPLSWLMFHLCIRSTNARVLSLQQCAVIGKACGIDDEEELKLALWYLSHQCGVFRYYSEVEGLQDLVICDLQVLFDSLTGLISSAFHFQKAFDEEEVRCRETGRFPVAEVEKLLERAQSDIPARKLITLFEHLRILCQCTHSSGVQEYFVPCILPSYEVETIESTSSSLLLTFSCGYCPMGYFSALTVHMASSVLSSSLEWRLCEGKLFQNKVSFHVGKDFDEVTLIARTTFYEIQIDRNHHIRNPLPLHEVCNEVRLTLYAALSTINLNSSLQLHHHVAFYCQNPKCHPVPHPAIPDCGTCSDEIVVCTCSKLPSQLTSKQCIWLGQEPCNQEKGENACGMTGEVLLEKVNDTKIDEDDLADVLEEVTEVTKWFNSGLALGLRPSTLEKIKIQYRENVDDCRREMLLCWLRRMDRVDQKGLPSWRSLVRALTSKLVYNPEIAEKIARKHPKL